MPKKAKTYCYYYSFHFISHNGKENGFGCSLQYTKGGFSVSSAMESRAKQGYSAVIVSVIEVNEAEARRLAPLLS
jgi:hypothetical protein